MRLGLVPSLVFAQQQLFLAPAPYSELAAQSAAAQFASHAKPYPPLPAPALESGSFPQYAVPFVEPRAEGPEDSSRRVTSLLAGAAAGVGLAMLLSTRPAVALATYARASRPSRSRSIRMWTYEEAVASGYDAGYIQNLETRVGTLVAACEGDMSRG